MAKGRIVKLIELTLPTAPGLLASVCGALAEAGVSIEAFRAQDVGAKAEILLAVKSGKKAGAALASLGGERREVEAVLVEMANKTGRLQKVAQKIADAGVNVISSWATAFTGKTASALFITADNAAALAAFAGRKKATAPKKPDA